MLHVYTVWAKKWGHNLMSIILSNLNLFTYFSTERFLGKFALNWLIKWVSNFLTAHQHIIGHFSAIFTKTHTNHCICCHTTLWNINARKQAINDILQGSVATHLKCGTVVNNQIKKGLLLSLWMNFFNRCLCWSGAQSARDNHVLACNFAKYSSTLILFHWHTHQ